MKKLVSLRTHRRRRGRVAIVAALTSCVVVVGVASAFAGGFNPFGDQQVSQTYANGILLPTNQWISPLGKRILDNDGTGGDRTVGCAARVEHDQPGRPIPRGARLEQLPGLPDDRRPEDRDDRAADARSTGTGRRTTTIRRSPPMGRCSRRARPQTPKPSGSRSRSFCRSTASTTALGRRPRRRRSFCAAPQTNLPAMHTAAATTTPESPARTAATRRRSPTGPSFHPGWRCRRTGRSYTWHSTAPTSSA